MYKYDNIAFNIFIEIIASFSADIIISLFANSLQIVYAQFANNSN